jgi:hypothetical protein
LRTPITGHRAMPVALGFEPDPGFCFQIALRQR